jgi:hypothetical protein
MKEQNKIGCLPAAFWFLGGVFLITGIAGIQLIGKDGFDGIASFFMIPLGGFLIYLGVKKHKDFKRKIEKEEKYEKEEKEKSIIRKEEINIQKNNEIKIKLIKADNLKIKLLEIQEIKIIDVSDYKNIIIDNEKSILDKGGDNQLFSFMKIDTFLRDYRGRITSDQSDLKQVLDIEWLKSRIKSEGQRNDLDKIIENLDDMTAKLEGRRTKGFDPNVDKLFELGDLMKPALENQIKTMEYYRNMAVAMIVFYLNDKKIRYFEIYEAFEKLGVFDSTWQKNVLNNLDNIEIRLAQISNQLAELNQNFISLVESSENVVSELKEINSSIITNNMLQAITAYQTWRINKNTKSLRN